MKRFHKIIIGLLKNSARNLKDFDIPEINERRLRLDSVGCKAIIVKDYINISALLDASLGITDPRVSWDNKICLLMYKRKGFIFLSRAQACVYAPAGGLKIHLYLAFRLESTIICTKGAKGVKTALEPLFAFDDIRHYGVAPMK